MARHRYCPEQTPNEPLRASQKQEATEIGETIETAFPFDEVGDPSPATRYAQSSETNTAIVSGMIGSANRVFGCAYARTAMPPFALAPKGTCEINRVGECQ